MTAMKQAEIHAYFQRQRLWTEDFLRRLLSIPSESGNEQKAMEFLAAFLADMGLPCRKLPFPEHFTAHPDYSDPIKGLSYSGQYNLSVETPGSNGKRIALNSHVDVVPPSPGQENPYTPRLDSRGVFWARGACDAKGQIAVMALLLKAATEMPRLAHQLVCHMVLEEELGGNGTLGLLEAEGNFSADLLINLEPTELSLLTSIRGAVWFEMEFTGMAGHAGSAGNTQSALDKAVAAIGLLQQYHQALYAKSKDYGLFAGIDRPMPLTIGECHAGNWPSMVSATARISGVMGLLPNVTKAEVMQDIRQLFMKEDTLWIGEGMQIHFPYRHNATELDPHHWAVFAMQQALRESGLDASPKAMTASTDAIYYHEKNIPCFAFGPGSLSDAHSCHEHIAVSDLMQAAETLYYLIQNIT